MKYLNLLLIFSCILISSCTFISGMDEEGKKMMIFVNQIVEEPDRMKELIYASEYYDSQMTEPIDSRILQSFIRSIKFFKKNGIEYHYDEDAVIIQLDKSRINGKCIYIGSGNILYDYYIRFFFQNIDNNWVLINVLSMNGY